MSNKIGQVLFGRLVLPQSKTHTGIPVAPEAIDERRRRGQAVQRCNPCLGSVAEPAHVVRDGGLAPADPAVIGLEAEEGPDGLLGDLQQLQLGERQARGVGSGRRGSLR